MRAVGLCGTLAALALLGGTSVPVAMASGSPSADGGDPTGSLGAPGVQRLFLPLDLPERFEVDTEVDGQRYTLRLVRRSLRSPRFTLRVHGADGREVDTVPPPIATYRGEVVEMPGTAIAADLRGSGLHADVFRGADLWATIRGLPGEDRSAGSVLQEVRGASELADPFDAEPAPLDWCRTDVERGSGPAGTLRATTGTGLYEAEIALDLDFPYYQQNGSSMAATVAAAESQLNTVDLIFARDVRITCTLTHVIVRTAPFYTTSNFLEQLRDEWNANQTAVPRDVAHLVTAGGPAGQGRLASVCDVEIAYSYSAGPPVVMAHELGHNVGSLHCHDHVPYNIMCTTYGYGLSIASNTKAVIERYRDEQTCLEIVGGHTEPFPPYADREIDAFTREEIAAGGGTRTLDVLANDHDGNLDPLTIEAFDPVSAKGGTVALSPGTGAGGADELVYTAPVAGFAGTDAFTYVVGDGTGRETAGDPELQVETPSLLAYWKLDGLTADATGVGRNVSLLGGTSFRPGRFAAALEFDGVDDTATATGFHRHLPALTITAWVRRAGNQDALDPIVAAASHFDHASLHFGAANELHYRWGFDFDNPTDPGFGSGFVVPDVQWTFVALAVEPDRATLYLHDGSTLQSASNEVAHRPLQLDTLYLGTDWFNPPHLLAGRIDDVRVYSYALTAAEILDLCDRGGRAYAADPPVAGGASPGFRRLRWGAGLEATSHDVYLGEDYVAVRDATTVSPEYRGRVTPAQLDVAAPLLPDRLYSWRVDEVTAEGIVRGEIWQFRVEGPLARWSLDETSGSTAADVAGGFDGTYVGAPLLGQAPPRPEWSRSVTVDGVDDRVEIGPLGADGDELTITAWVRRQGAQASGAAILAGRSASSFVALNFFGGDNLLAYKWNEHGTLFGSEFLTALTVADGVWTPIALVIARDHTRVHVRGTGGWSTYARIAPNGIERFDGTLRLGADPALGAYFRGGLDDVRIYRYPMSAAQLADLFADGVSAGRVPDGASAPGAPLRVDRSAGGAVTLSWSDSCVAADQDFGVYEGTMGDFASHVPAACTTAGATTLTFDPGTGSRYFLVVPQSANREGRYGVASDGSPRPASVAPCRPAFPAACP